MLKNVVRFNPSRKNEHLHNLIIQVQQDKADLRVRKKERREIEEERNNAFMALDSIIPIDDPEVLRAAIKRAEPLASGSAMIACIFKARKKLAMLEGDMLLQSVADSEDATEIKQALYDVKAVPYVNTTLNVHLKRRVETSDREQLRPRSSDNGTANKPLSVAAHAVLHSQGARISTAGSTFRSPRLQYCSSDLNRKF
eukprot:gnl/MRDRNA2_/MRDRNA2_34449_c0_seq1.p1 gnl/MRDRNA2_/MRDRNA2_34449_c0~~gnl/MRDRNA2_/MRDRNA2_34449_c0_seq1.p1  ORF type:complete len:198 (+),score=38.87 gnl/MRDRNA2_/MRDRNA2_34449_c0_seq1:147-740(+)